MKEPEYHPNSLKSKDKIIKLHDETLKKCIKITNHFIDSEIKSMTWHLDNGFTVTFRDRKRNRIKPQLKLIKPVWDVEKAIRSMNTREGKKLQKKLSDSYRGDR